MAISEKKRLALVAARKRRVETGRLGGRTKGVKNAATIDRDKSKEHLLQRYLGATDVLANAQLTIARGQTFLYKIEKEWVSFKKGGYWKNLPPKLVTSQEEIESYLEELAENNGDLSDDKDPGTTYYFLTTKEPNNEALKDIQNRVFGKPTEHVEHSGSIDLYELHEDEPVKK